MPDIEKLRRFALIAALALILYSVAGIQLTEGAEAKIFDIPFTISKPEFLPFVLFLASIYGVLRYLYYAIMLLDTPNQKRRKALRNLQKKDKEVWSNYHLNGEKMQNHEELKKKIIDECMYIGALYYIPNMFTKDYEELKKQIYAVDSVFPKVGRFRVFDRVRSLPGIDRSSYDALIIIPLPCRLAALIEDIDYLAPVWVNIFAWVMWLGFTRGIAIF